MTVPEKTAAHSRKAISRHHDKQIEPERSRLAKQAKEVTGAKTERAAEREHAGAR